MVKTGKNAPPRHDLKVLTPLSLRRGDYYLFNSLLLLKEEYHASGVGRWLIYHSTFILFRIDPLINLIGSSEIIGSFD
jgi:hypothetical protein